MNRDFIYTQVASTRILQTTERREGLAWATQLPVVPGLAYDRRLPALFPSLVHYTMAH